MRSNEGKGHDRIERGREMFKKNYLINPCLSKQSEDPEEGGVGA